MRASKEIETALQQVQAVRQQAQANPSLGNALKEIKKFQAARFAATYCDLLASPDFGASAKFFLEELYSERDYTQRDEQFAKVAKFIEITFPEAVVATTLKLAKLHSATETLDQQMAASWLKFSLKDETARYLQAWQSLNCRQQREWQLDTVLHIGMELGTLTQSKGLRLLLRMMRQPASLAGLGDLQRFLESGFDRFAQLSRRKGAVAEFLTTIREREQAWISRMEHADSAHELRASDAPLKT